MGTNWVTMGVNADGLVYFSCSARLDNPEFHLNGKDTVNGVTNTLAFRNTLNNSLTSNSLAYFNIWGAHYLSFFDVKSTNQNFQDSAGIADYHIVVGNGADSVNTNNASYAGYYHANLRFSGF